MTQRGINELGNIYGRLLVVKRLARPPLSRNGVFWRCRCSCGATVTVSGACLRRGKTRSCGCYRRECGGLVMLLNNKHRAQAMAHEALVEMGLLS